MNISYQTIEKKAKTLGIWKIALGGMVAINLICVVFLSFNHTMEIARQMDMNPWLTAGMVEAFFTITLVVRARQRTGSKNVPWFLEGAFWFSFLVVTTSNVAGLSDKPYGGWVGIIISVSMWMMEMILVWFWTKSENPEAQTIRKQRKELTKKIKEIQFEQEKDWMIHEAKKPALSLIKKARTAEEKRNKEIEKGLPSYFLQTEQTDTRQTAKKVVSLERPKQPEPIQEPAQPKEEQPVERKKEVGFISHMAETKTTVKYGPEQVTVTQNQFQSKPEMTEKAMKTAIEYYAEHKEYPSIRNLAEMAGVKKHYAEKAMKEIRKQTLSE